MKAAQVVAEGHFILNGGWHSPIYFNKDYIGSDPDLLSDVTAAMSEMICETVDDDEELVLVAAPMGAIRIATMMSDWMQVPNVYADEVKKYDPQKDAVVRDGFIIDKRGFPELMAGKKLAIIEDIVTTGTNLMQIDAAIKKLGIDCEIVGAWAVINRGNITAADLGIPIFESLLEVKVSAYEDGFCPLCENKIPINTDLGKGAQHLAVKAASK